MLMHSCWVKLPNEALKSKLSGQALEDVVEEDLTYFKNLAYLDVSDNHLRMNQFENL